MERNEKTFAAPPAALYSLEEDWTDVVKGALVLGERARSQQTAIWELVETEVAYIRTLKVIQDVSRLQLNQLLIEDIK